VIAVEHHHATRPKNVVDLVYAARVVVVVTEHRDDRNRETGARIREDLGLFRKAVRREIAGEEDEVHVLRDRREHACEPIAQGLCGMDVACRGDPDRGVHRA